MHRMEAYFRLAALFFAGAFLLSLPVLIHRSKKGVPLLRQFCRLALYFSIFIILFATVFYMELNFKPEQYVINLTPFQWLEADNLPVSERLITEVLSNVLLFIPLGLFLPLSVRKFRRFYKTALIILGSTVVIETFQYFTGRSCDIDDVIANLLGGIIGYALFKLCQSLFRNKNAWRRAIA